MHSAGCATVVSVAVEAFQKGAISEPGNLSDKFSRAFDVREIQVQAITIQGCAISARVTVPTPTPNCLAMARMLAPRWRISTALSRLKIRFGLPTGEFFPERL